MSGEIASSAGDFAEIMTVRISYAPGRLPSFWDRSVVFFANLLALFYGNRGATDELEATVGEIETYGGRLCPLLNLLFKGPSNLLVLESRPDDCLLRYFSDRLGLDLPEIVVLHHSRYDGLGEHLAGVLDRTNPADTDAVVSRIASHPAGWIDGFVTDGVLTAAGEILGKRTIISSEISRQGNNKLLLHRFLEEQGFPVFETELARSAADLPAAVEALAKKGYRQVVVKAQVGASGIGMRKLEVEDPEFESVGEHMFFEGPCLVQGWLDDTVDGVRRLGSPSVQMFLDEDHVCLYDVTEQVLSPQSIHEGNSAPPSYWKVGSEVEEQLRDQATAAALWLHEVGYRGTASGDFLVLTRRGQVETRLCEINARVTGATYPSVLARHFLPGGAWLMRNLRFDPPPTADELLEGLRRKARLFDPGASGGVLPINFNADRAGAIPKGQFLCLGADDEECLEHMIHAAEILPVTWTYDRD